MYIFIEFLQAQPIFYLFFVFLIGLAVGSFLNVVIVRLPIMIEKGWREECCNFLGLDSPNTEQKERFNLIRPFSHCPSCKQKIKILKIFIIIPSHNRGRVISSGRYLVSKSITPSDEKIRGIY